FEAERANEFFALHRANLLIDKGAVVANDKFEAVALDEFGLRSVIGLHRIVFIVIAQHALAIKGTLNDFASLCSSLGVRFGRRYYVAVTYETGKQLLGASQISFR